MIKARLLRVALAVLVISIIPLCVSAEERLALVIGNAAYQSSPLRNPANDAADVAAALKDLGFKVTLLRDASKKEMGKAIENFGRELKGRDVGLFYYAGHGIQVNGVNYLVPVRAKINEESDVEYEALDAGRVLAAMFNAGSRVNIVILDACRDNPYIRSFRSTTRGLAIISKAPSGTIISYSTSPGDVALDGKGRNSPYTAFLIKYMREPGLTVEQVFKNVRQELKRQTTGRQVPWELSSLEGEFYFTPGRAAVSPARIQSASIGADRHHEPDSSFFIIDGTYMKKDKAVAIPGSSRNIIIEITDPDCIFCRKASEFLASKDAARYVYFFPLQNHTDSRDKILYILCSNDKAGAYHEVMSGKLDNTRIAECRKRYAREDMDLHMNYSQGLGIQGTPTFFVNGQKVVGFQPGRIDELLK